ncbi:MAG: hypothetical protein JRI95_14950 [Deltaproteobacteria bacterium]|nr:hypothetical protein [Deltaproteobacteria bacterium]MBW2085602.1 hypothetical protein [Deltaproteobacteria bacterium]
MTESIDEITINYEEDGILVIEELEKIVLNRGAWTTILFLFRERDRRTGEFGPPKAGLRRYQKFRGLFRKRDAINLSEKTAGVLLEKLTEWFDQGKSPKQDPFASDST